MFRVAAVAVVLAALSSSAAELSYQWKKSDVHRFAWQESTTIDMSVMGMAHSSVLEVRSQFAEKILSVRPDGVAEVELTLEQLAITQSGQPVATLEQLPQAARVVRAEVDKKGHARFFRMTTVYLRDDQLYVGVSSAPGQAHGVASAGGERVELVARWDPKTGKLIAGASVTKAEPRLKAVEVKEDDPHVDVLPRRVFELMVLPDGDLQPGSTFTAKTMLGDIQSSLSTLEKNVGTLRFRIDGAAVAAQAEGDEPTGAPAFALPGMPMPGANVNGPALNLDVAINAGFDFGKGRLVTVEGTLRQNFTVSGMMSVVTNSAFTLKRVER